ncbi:hypothetical protein E3T23_06600 [Cryobacterium cheniae]|uniref:Uncharacterized protein n=1 Tax=Cryobacterium cheniae TaxID=1259262 RepID=A0A4R8XSM6_9MICO|nr:hypothetical protein [Cryobacterium cheniae]TFC81162.1 hypothetical protein E3T23_06600 [Cryobacterium cheniae]
MKTSSNPSSSDSYSKTFRSGASDAHPSRRSKRDYPSKDQIQLFKDLMVRTGIAPTSSLVNMLKKMTITEASGKIAVLLQAAEAVEAARSAHPDGPRSTAHQMTDWGQYKAKLREEITPAELAHVLNLSVNAMRQETAQLKSRFWKMEDFAGRTTEWREVRGMYSPEDIQAGADHREHEHQHTMAEATARHQRQQEASLKAAPEDMRDLLSL